MRFPDIFSRAPLTVKALRGVSLDASELAAIRSAFDNIMLRNLKYVALVVSMLYWIFILDHALFDPPFLLRIMGFPEAVTSLALMALYAAISRGLVSSKDAQFWGAAVALLLLGTDVLHYVMSLGPEVTADMILVEIGVGVFFLSLEWLVVLTGITAIAWLVPTLSIARLRPNLAEYGAIFLASIIVSVLIQISRIRSLSELELSYLKFRRLSDSAMEGIAIYRNGIITDVNRNFLRIFEYERAELIGTPLEPLFPLDKFQWTPAMAEMSQTRIIEGRGKRKNGQSFPIEFSTRKIDSSREPTLALAVQEISKRKQVEQTLEEQRLKMIYSSKMSALGEMAAGISHEIKNPLTAMMLKVDLLREKLRRGVGSPELSERLLAQIHSDGSRISKIITGLSTLARDNGTAAHEPANVKRIIEEALSLTTERSKRQGIEVHVESIPENLMIECRPAQIFEVLLNLLANAFDAVENLPERWVNVSLHDLGEEIEIGVTDSGKGIPPNVRDKIMQPFFTTKGPKRGTGLGLSISRRLVEMHHGVLELDPRSAHTRFYFRLPKVQAGVHRKTA